MTAATLVDSHCHLDDGNCPEGADAVIARANDAGVGTFVSVGVGRDLEPARQAVALANRRADVFATVGVHPHDAAGCDAEVEAEIARLATDPRVVAVGEIGLDYHYMRSPKDVQHEVFRRFIALAKQLDKPIVIHTRSAPDDTLETLAAEGARDVGGVIHCFSEDKAFAEKALDLDFDLSFSGIVTFNSARAVQEVAAWAPLDHILFETDSPYLAPMPHRGKRCEPAYVAHTARFVAGVRKISLEDLALATTANARRRLGLCG